MVAVSPPPVYLAVIYRSGTAFDSITETLAKKQREIRLPALVSAPKSVTLCDSTSTVYYLSYYRSFN